MRTFSLVIGVCTVLAAGRLKAEDRQMIDSARKILKANRNAMVGVNAIAKIQIKAAGGGGGEREMKIECTSLVIDGSGLAVTSLTNLNPQTVLRGMRVNRRGGGEAPAEVTFECELSGIKMRLPDGTELPARVLLKDEDLDLAFVGPNDPLSGENKKKISAVSLEASKPAEVLDTIVELGRTGKDFNYAPAVQIGHIAAVLSKPRTCYLGATSGLGTPVFGEQGKLTGLVTRLVLAEKESDGDTLSNALRGQAGGMSRIILPTAEIVKLVDQAKEAAKKPAPKEE
jgi:hypothetical protein